MAPRWVAPVAGGAAAAAGLAYVWAFDPAKGGTFIPCPFHRLTGRWCPGCGMTRALHDLLHGDVRSALGTNLFLPVVVVLAGYLWLSWLWPAVTGRRLDLLHRVPSAVWTGLIVLALDLRRAAQPAHRPLQRARPLARARCAPSARPDRSGVESIRLRCELPDPIASSAKRTAVTPEALPSGASRSQPKRASCRTGAKLASATRGIAERSE